MGTVVCDHLDLGCRYRLFEDGAAVMTNSRIDEILRAMETGETGLFIQPFELIALLRELKLLRGEVDDLETMLLREFAIDAVTPDAILRGLG